ncbi:MAG: hypothetical protein HYX72_02205 [Acidobacteria bacterium]|nr:hypothetical protein [Acidobacteriota bacterium]
MAGISHLRDKAREVAIWGSLVAIAGFLVFSGSGGVTGAAQGGEATGYPQLVSVQPLAEMGGEMCHWSPASARSTLLAALQQAGPAQEAAPTEAARAKAAKRQPVRAIRDSYAAYSAVAVDPVHNEVVMTDENLFSILVYNRLENTPPKAAMSEPRRIIQGANTEIEFLCSVYVDPTSGDIYALNGDVSDKLIVFSRHARGDTVPDRYLETPHTTYGIAVDEKSQEMMLTIQDDAAVVTFRKSAKERDAPIRTLQGERTLLADPHGIAIDPKTDRLFVTNWGTVNLHKPPESGPVIGTLGRGAGVANWPIGRNYALPGSGKFLPPSITVYPRAASGNTAPLQVIQGAKTQLNWPTALALDPERGELYVANDPSDSVLVFKSDANGDVAPIRVLQGPKTLIKNPTGVYLDLKNDEVWVANFGNHSATVYKRGAGGDTPPLRMIRSAPLGSPAPMMGNPHAVVYDSKRDELLVSN